jgi:uncharacterized membrane protein YsdA (DUF1294 family)
MQRTYRKHRYQINAIILSMISLLLMFGILYIITKWSPHNLWIISASVVTFALFGIDKTLSRTDQTRIPESVLHIFTLLGGFLGQILGRIVFNHKTNFKRHPSFTIVLVISILIQVAIVVFIL